LHARDSEITAAIQVVNLRIEDASNSAITVHGPKTMRDVTLDGVHVNGAAEHGIHIKGSVSGTLQQGQIELNRVVGEQVRNEAVDRFHIKSD
jgi:hypothetical protein